MNFPRRFKFLFGQNFLDDAIRAEFLSVSSRIAVYKSKFLLSLTWRDIIFRRDFTGDVLLIWIFMSIWNGKRSLIIAANLNYGIRIIPISLYNFVFLYPAMLFDRTHVNSFSWILLEHLLDQVY